MFNIHFCHEDSRFVIILFIMVYRQYFYIYEEAGTKQKGLLKRRTIIENSVRNIRRLLWEEGLGETPDCKATVGSPAAHGKRSIFLKRVSKAAD
jgi:hypothetical protein